MLDRREFIGAIGVSGLALSAIAGERIVKPARIRPGDKVGLVNPATAAFDTQTIEITVESLESLGLQVELGQNYYDWHGYFTGNDEARPAYSGKLAALFLDDVPGVGRATVLAHSRWSGFFVNISSHWVCPLSAAV